MVACLSLIFCNFISVELKVGSCLLAFPGAQWAPVTYWALLHFVSFCTVVFFRNVVLSQLCVTHLSRLSFICLSSPCLPSGVIFHPLGLILCSTNLFSLLVCLFVCLFFYASWLAFTSVIFSFFFKFTSLSSYVSPLWCLMSLRTKLFGLKISGFLKSFFFPECICVSFAYSVRHTPGDHAVGLWLLLISS